MKSAIVYLMVVVLVLGALDLTLLLLFDYAIFPLLDWFNGIHWVWKIILFLVGALAMVMSLLQALQRALSLLGGKMFDNLPANGYVKRGGELLAMVNAVITLIILWRQPAHYNFWVVIELIVLSVFIWTLISIVMPTKVQIEMFNAEDDKEEFKRKYR
jgi:hypothetical protein